MEFKLNEDQQMIHDLAKDFAESVLQPRIDEIEAGEMTEDELKAIEKETQDLTDKYCKQIDDMAASKSKEILEI